MSQAKEMPFQVCPTGLQEDFRGIENWDGGFLAGAKRMKVSLSAEGKRLPWKRHPNRK